MPKVRRGSITIELDIKDMLIWLQEDWAIDTDYVEERLNSLFGVKVPFADKECDIYEKNGRIIIFCPTEED